MEHIHFRPWTEGTIGGEMQVPCPVTKNKKKLVEQPKAGTLNFSKRKLESERIHSANVKLFQRLAS